MTQPQELPEVPAEEVTALEVAAVAAVTGGLAAMLAPALASILALYEALSSAMSPLSRDAVRDVAVQRLTDLYWPPMDLVAMDYGAQAQFLGQSRAIQEVPLSEIGTIRLEPLERVTLDGAVRERLNDAVKLARTLPLDTKQNVMAMIGRASSAKSLAEGTTRAVVYCGVSRGKVSIARAAGRNLLWVPERDACLHCLAHAGWVWAPGKLLPKGLTYADKPLKVRVKYPPLHPNCRCEAVLTALPVGAPSRERSRTDPAARLAAEARRSVVLGWTDHASQAATLRAMDRLLRQGADLPTSVEQRARRALQAGRTVRRPR